MGRKRIPDELMTEEQRTRRTYQERYRNKIKKVVRQNVKKKRVIKEKSSQIMATGTDDNIYEKKYERNIVAGATILQFPVNEEREIYPSEREISLIQEVEFLKQELSKLNEKNMEKCMEKSAEKDVPRKWGEVLRKAVSPDAVLSAGSLLISSTFLILVSAVCGYASVRLTSPFFGEGIDGMLAAASAEGLAGFFAIFAALNSNRVVKWSSRLFGFGIVAIVTAFCFDGIESKVGSDARKSSDSYKTLTREMETSQATVSRLSAQVEALPTDWVSKRAALEGQILEERDRISSLSGKIESLPLETGGSWKVMGHFSIRLWFGVALMVLCELLVGIAWKGRLGPNFV